MKYSTILCDPPWRFTNRTGKIAPEHRRLSRYQTMSTRDIAGLPVGSMGGEPSHLYLWVPAALLADGLTVMEAWGYRYKTTLVWEKVRGDGQPDGRCCGFYYRVCTEFLLFGVRGKLRTLPPGRRTTNVIRAVKREHSRKPDEFYGTIEACSLGPYMELFARHRRPGWTQWGDQLDGQSIFPALAGMEVM